jgi:hypothetical protein
MLSIIDEKEDFEVNCLYRTIWDSYPGIGLRKQIIFIKKKLTQLFILYVPFNQVSFSTVCRCIFGVVDHFRASALTTADRRPPSWNRITDSRHAPPDRNVGG